MRTSTGPNRALRPDTNFTVHRRRDPIYISLTRPPCELTRLPNIRHVLFHFLLNLLVQVETELSKLLKLRLTVPVEDLPCVRGLVSALLFDLAQIHLHF